MMMDTNSEQTISQADADLKNEFSGRLIHFLRENGLSQKDLSQLSGESTSKINAYCNGKALPAVTAAIAIAESLGVSVPELILGRESSVNSLRPVAPGFNVPLLASRLSAGAGLMAEENQIGAMPIPVEVMRELRRTDTKGLIMMQAKGDSMAPTVPEDAFVLVDTLSQVLTEGVFAFRFGESLRVKRLRPVGLGDIEVISDNPIYPPERIVGSEKEHFELIGRAIWTGGRI